MSEPPTQSGKSVPREALAAVSLPGMRTEVRRLRTNPAAAGWLRVESSAICGTDVSLYSGGLAVPTVMGHHVIGTVVDLTPETARRWGVDVGDRVALEEYLPCGACEECERGVYRMCAETDLWRGRRRVGLQPVDVCSGLSGGNGEYVELQQSHVPHLVPKDLSATLAAWTLPLANAIDWTLDAAQVTQGSTVAIVGPGYHGLAAIAAARHAGAAQILAIGLPRDAPRLAMAERLGALPIDASGDVVGLVRAATGGRGVDAVIDTAGASTDTLNLNLRLLARFGRLIVAGISGGDLSKVDLQLVVREVLTLSGVRGRSPDAVRRSIDLLASGKSGLDVAVPTLEIGLDEVGSTLSALSEGHGPATPHVVVKPRLSTPAAHTLQPTQEALP